VANRVGGEGTPTKRKSDHGNAKNQIAETVFEQRWTLEGDLFSRGFQRLKSVEKESIAGNASAWWTSRVTFIDRSGEKALAQLSKQGAELIATGIYLGRRAQHREEKVESSE